MRDLSQGTRVMFLTSLVGGFENGRVGVGFVVVGCEVRVGWGVGCGCDGVDAC
jgi:hypothetical protein